LLAPLFPGLYRWLSLDSSHRMLLAANLDFLDRLSREETPPTPLFFLAAFFGPVLEAGALEHQRDGMPHQQALEMSCAAFLEELCRTVQVPVRLGGRLRNILIMQTALHRMPPRRPAALAARLDFAEALSYLRLGAETRGENIPALKWWEAFLAGSPVETIPVSNPSAVPPKRRRRRRRRRRHAQPAA
jgi:hypothetical protein